MYVMYAVMFMIRAVGDPDNGVPAGTPWEKVPDTWVCPECGAGKDQFSKQ